MKKTAVVVAYTTALCCLILKIGWLTICNNPDPAVVRAAAFHNLFPPLFVLVVDLLALASFVFLVRRQATITPGFPKFLNTVSLTIIGIYLFLELWQYL